MEAALRTPLVECFRRGEADREVRLEAAVGALVDRAPERLTLLVLLAEDADPEVAATAMRTLDVLSASETARFLASEEATSELCDFFARRGILPTSAGQAPPPHQPAPPATRDGDDATDSPASADTSEGGADAAVVRRLGTAQRLTVMTVSERVKAAVQGSREERGVLIRDPNRLVAAAVLSSPKLTESEVEAIARMGNVSDEVLRSIGTNRTWTKNYNVVSSLVRNAKTPIAVSLGLLKRLNERDIKSLSSDRNIPEPIRVAARKAYAQSQTRRQ